MTRNSDFREYLVVGDGQMGHAYANRLATIPSYEPSRVQIFGESGWRAATRQSADLLILAVSDGTQANEVMSCLVGETTPLVLDLTTQQISEVIRNMQLAAAAGISYFAGGVLGGSTQVLSGDALILLGPGPVPEAAVDVLRTIGKVREFPTVEAACGAKLLHNLVLVLNNHNLAIAMRFAEEFEISDLEEILDAGTAGRAPSESSAVRDFRSEPTSSYLSRLVAKDLVAIRESFPRVDSSVGVDLESLISFYSAGGSLPYTQQALSQFGPVVIGQNP